MATNFNSTNNKAVTETGTQSLENKTVNGVVLSDQEGASVWLNGSGVYTTPSGGGDMAKATYDPQTIEADAFARANHTGTQAISTVTDLQAELDAKFKTVTNLVQINSLSDLTDYSTPNGSNEIELCPSGDVAFLIGALNIDISPYTLIATGGAAHIYGAHKAESRITSNSVNPLIRVASQSFFINDMQLSNPNGKIIEFAGNGFNSFTPDNITIISCDTIGTITGALTASLRTCTVVSTTTGGLTLTGANSQFNMTNCLFGEFVAGASWTGTLLDFNGSTWDLISIPSNNRFFTSSGNTAISGLANSGNINAGGSGIIVGNVFSGLGTYLVNIGESSDLRWEVKGNSGIKDTQKDAQGYNHTTTTTTISVGDGDSGNPKLMNGAANWVATVENQFTLSTGGRLTYIGLDDQDFHIRSVVNGTAATGNSVEFNLYLAKNGTVVDASLITREYSSGSNGTVTTAAIIPMTTNDYVELYVENITSTQDWVSNVVNLIATSS